MELDNVEALAREGIRVPFTDVFVTRLDDDWDGGVSHAFFGRSTLNLADQVP